MHIIFESLTKCLALALAIAGVSVGDQQVADHREVDNDIAPAAKDSIGRPEHAPCDVGDCEIACVTRGAFSLSSMTTEPLIERVHTRLGVLAW
eukprot:scaffold143485_cov31-Tisochrysis_lutea.AAC.1